METVSTTTSANGCKTWEAVLADEKQQPYFQAALNFVKQERLAGKIIYPPQAEIFNALKFTPFDQVKVVIIGQDPYHGPNQAHGLCFSVRPGIPFPPSLENIFKELHDDLKVPSPKNGCLEKWAKQGVLLLNATLTVEAGKPLSHANVGWEIFTDKVIKVLNEQRSGLIFLLWGSQAQRKGQGIDPTRHYILKAPHPSPLSAHRGFFGCRHFSKTNELLRKMNKPEIDWQLE
ncbi:MAG: uracil-DNA glycosylase [Gammaproteobacteria bacterium]